MTDHADEQPSQWIVRFAPLVAPGATVLDVACGTGRHARLFIARECRVTAVDREPRLEPALVAHPNVEVQTADLENGAWPFAGRQFDAVVVTNYLHRPLFPHLITALAAGGLLLYETFAAGNAAFGKPSNPDYLLNPRELLATLGPSLRVIAFEDGFVRQPRKAMVQRLAARRAAPEEVLDANGVALQAS